MAESGGISGPSHGAALMAGRGDCILAGRTHSGIHHLGGGSGESGSNLSGLFSGLGEGIGSLFTGLGGSLGNIKSDLAVLSVPLFIS